MVRILTDLKSSLWFVPGLLVLLAAALAIGAVELDTHVSREAFAKFPRLFGAGAEGARQLLSAIASSTITVAGVVFSITIVALSLAAGQYSPRVLRNFMGDRANQIVLGSFVGIYVYCLIVLRTVRGGDDTFIPGISILIALGLALLGIGFLIFFIHHVATTIQASEICAHISRETIASLRALLRKERDETDDRKAGEQAERLAWRPIAAVAGGYIQHVNIDALLACAREHRRAVRMEKAVGDFVIEGQPLLSLAGNEEIPASAAGLLHAFTINTYRDVAQDAMFGIHQLVDISLKALSPGVNDTGTARNAFDYLSAILCELAGTTVDDRRYFTEDGELLLVRRTHRFEDYVNEAVGPVRRAAANNLDMIFHVLRSLAELGCVTRSSERHAAVERQVLAIDEALQRLELSSADRSEASALVRRALEALGGGKAQRRRDSAEV